MSRPIRIICFPIATLNPEKENMSSKLSIHTSQLDVYLVLQKPESMDAFPSVVDVVEEHAVGLVVSG
jgi:hypothetical protein